MSNYEQRNERHMSVATIQSKLYLEKTYEQYSAIFKKHGCVNITKLIDFISFTKLSEETFFLLRHKKRRSFSMEETSFTPRIMHNVKQPIIKKYGDYIPEIYQSPSLKNLIYKIGGEKIYDLPWEEEKYLINCMSEPGDTHGWHWDDYSYAIIFIIKAPKCENGGLVQCVPNTKWENTSDIVNRTLCENKVNTYFFSDREAYLLKSNTTMHRVTALVKKDFRLIINMSWANSEDLKKNMDHTTMSKLYA